MPSFATFQEPGQLTFAGARRLLQLLIGCIVAASLAVVPASAQAPDEDPVADTLDWRGYVPLAVGNVWQYANHAHMSPFGTTDEWVETWDITADTTLASEAYFAVEVTCDSIYTHPELGRNPCGGSSTRVNADGLASGHYQLVLRASGRTVGSRAVVIVR